MGKSVNGHDQMNAANGETVLITGASSGIGLELARCFAADKSSLVLVARNTGALQSLADELRCRHGIQTTVLTADLSRPETPARVFNELQQAGITVDVLVNNAGFGAHGSFAGLPLRRQLEMIQVNVAALTELTGLFLPGMIERKRGGVLNVGSVAGFVPGPGMAVYFATKAYVLSFTEALAGELAGTGLAVTASSRTANPSSNPTASAISTAGNSDTGALPCSRRYAFTASLQRPALASRSARVLSSA